MRSTHECRHMNELLCDGKHTCKSEQAFMLTPMLAANKLASTKAHGHASVRMHAGGCMGTNA